LVGDALALNDVIAIFDVTVTVTVASCSFTVKSQTGALTMIIMIITSGGGGASPRIAFPMALLCHNSNEQPA
jgi:hypothetical protein